MKSRFQFPLAAKLGLAVIAAQSLVLLALGSLHLQLHAAETPETLRALWLWIVSGSLAAILVTTPVLGWMTRRLVTARIRSLAGAVRRLADGEPGARLPEAAQPDEIGQLGADFNAMAERLEEKFAALQRKIGESDIAGGEYRSLVENACEAILVVQSGGIVFANPEAGRMLGVPHRELMGRAIADFLHPEDRDFVMERHARRLSGEAPPNRYEFRMLPADGRTLWVGLHVVRIDWRGAAATLNFVADVTERRRVSAEKERLQDQLIQAQKMESVGRLAGGVAHDFNNMLQAILGNVDLAISDTAPGHPARPWLDEIRKSTLRSADLTRQLLAFARKQVVAPRVLDLNDALSAGLGLARRLIGENIELHFRPHPGLWAVEIDPGQLDQMLTHLCLNARDAIAGVGRIVVETANVSLDEAASRAEPGSVPGDHVRFTVADTGCGMDAETRARVFEPFFTTKAPGQGTGLGLATVFGIAQQNGGFVTVSSEPGRGSRFSVWLPRSASGNGPAKPETPETEAAVRGTETVLLVEDEVQILRLGRRVLTRLGYRVLAHSPTEALSLAAAEPEPLHLLVTDVALPGTSGRELFNRLRQRHPGIRCVLMSGFTAQAMLDGQGGDEAVRFLQKPFTLRSLTRTVRATLDA